MRFTRQCAIRARTGFTLAELIVAIVLVETGLLALAASTGVLVRRQTETRARANALTAASNRLQLLSLERCAPQYGTASAGGVTEQWSIDTIENGTRELRDSVTFVAGTERHVVLATRLPC